MKPQTITIQRISVYLQSFLYVAAGINHFVHPRFYTRIIPPWLPNHLRVNYLSGIIEITLGLLLAFPFTRTFAAYGIIAMLIAFIPAHIYMIQIGNCTTTQLCWLLVLVWLRLVIGQPLLIWWAWLVRRES